MEILGRLAATTDTPMVIVTAAAPDGRRSGCLVGFWTQCSIHPPRVLACISKANHTLPVATDGWVLAVHWLADDGGSPARSPSDSRWATTSPSCSTPLPARRTIPQTANSGSGP